MAKLKARGREEIFRVTKVETGGSREGIKNRIATSLHRSA